MWFRKKYKIAYIDSNTYPYYCYEINDNGEEIEIKVNHIDPDLYYLIEKQLEKRGYTVIMVYRDKVKS